MRQGCYKWSWQHNEACLGVALWTSGTGRAILKCNNGTEQVAMLSEIMVCVSARGELQKCTVGGHLADIQYWHCVVYSRIIPGSFCLALAAYENYQSQRMKQMKYASSLCYVFH